MPTVKPEWIAALRQIDDKADLRFNYHVNRWEFILTGADMKPQSQFWCRFDATRMETITDPVTGKTYTQEVPDRDPVTGMMPYRDLNDREFAVALANLQRTFVGNPYDGQGTVQRDVGRRYFHNKYLQEKRWQQRGEEFADFVWDHRRQLRDAGAGPLITVTEALR